MANLSNLIRYRSLASLLNDFEKNANQLWNPSEQYLANLNIDSWLPPVDIKEENDRYVVKADIPGVEVKDIKTSIDQQNNLIIEGEKESEFKKEEKNYSYTERSKGSFYRKINLPLMVDAENITAKYKNGVLEIIIPKTKKSTAKQIDIKS